MFDKLLIIGCGLIGSSLLRATINKKLSKKILAVSYTHLTLPTNREV